MAVTRPPFEKSYGYILAALVGLFIADLSITAFRHLALPTKAPPAKPKKISRAKQARKSDYNRIIARNVFNSDGLIPPPIGADKEEKSQDDGIPVPSELPLDLVGTLVHANPKLSVASIKLRSKNDTKPFQVGGDIDGLATVEKIERKKVIFRNTSTARLEYIEIPDELKISFGIKKKKGEKGGTEVQKQTDNEFTLKRDTINKYTENLQDLLQQARAVPNFVPGSDGQVDGFRVLQIQSGSIFEKLGIKPMDVIKTVNGEPLDSPAKAMELYQALKSSSNIELSLERNGRDQTMRYNIVE